MIGKLKGLVESISDDSVLVDVGGVCYEVFLSTRALSQLPAVGNAVALMIETHVREDHIHLFGFLTASEKAWFMTLCKVQGVGAKMGQGILSSFTPMELAHAIHARDAKMLTRATGVGPKLGERLVTELKNKIAHLPTDDLSMPQNSGQPAKKSETASKSSTQTKQVKNEESAGNADLQEAVSALANLGYGRSEAYQIVAKIRMEQPEIKLNELIRQSLQQISA